MNKPGLEKAEEPEIKLLTYAGSLKKQENSRKACTSASLIMLKILCGSQQTGKFLKRWDYQTTLTVSWGTCMQVKKQQWAKHGTRDWLKIGKGVRQRCISIPCLFNLYAEYMMRNEETVTDFIFLGS